MLRSALQFNQALVWTPDFVIVNTMSNDSCRCFNGEHDTKEISATWLWRRPSSPCFAPPNRCMLLLLLLVLLRTSTLSCHYRNIWCEKQYCDRRRKKKIRKARKKLKKGDIRCNKNDLSSFEQWDGVKVYFSFIVFPSCSLHGLTSSYGWPLLLSLFAI